MKALALLFLLLAPSLAAAETFKCVDPRTGKTSYTDKPAPGCSAEPKKGGFVSGLLTRDDRSAKVDAQRARDAECKRNIDEYQRLGGKQRSGSEEARYAELNRTTRSCN